MAALVLTTAAVATALVWTAVSHLPIIPLPFGLAPVAVPITERTLIDHTGYVDAVATAQLNGRPVVISGTADKTVRVWDLDTGQPVGTPFTGRTGTVWAVATAQLNGRPAVISGSGDATVRVWDLATGQLIGTPFTAPTILDHRFRTCLKCSW